MKREVYNYVLNRDKKSSQLKSGYVFLLIAAANAFATLKTVKTAPTIFSAV